MSSIGKAVTSSTTSILAQQFAKAATQRTLAKETSATATDSSATAKSDFLNAEFTAFFKRWDEAKRALEKLGKATQETNQAKKAIAAEIIKRIKEQLRILMMLASTDPKTRARQLAALASELAAAVRLYASAAGDTAQTGDTSSTASSSQTDAAATSSDAQSVATDTAATSVDASTETADTSQTSATDAAQTTQSSSDSTNPQNAQAGNKLAAYTQTSSSSATSKEDQEFAAEVRKLAAQIKALAEQNAARARERADQTTGETAATYEALRSVDTSLAAIDAGSAVDIPTINIVAS